MTLYGGTKIIIKNSDGSDHVISKIKDQRQFIDIFKHIINVEEVAVSSLYGLILRVTIPVENSPFRSDIYDENNELMNSSIYMNTNTGMIVTDIIFKCCIIQESRVPLLDNYQKFKKSPTTIIGFLNEYNAQAYTYTSTMINGGYPVCPDVLGIITFTASEFSTLFSNEDSPFPDILKKSPVFEYLLQQKRSVGIIVMESLPSIYENYGLLIKEMNRLPAYKPLKILGTEIAENILSILTILIYRVGIIPLDAHSNNWMYIDDSYWTSLSDEKRELLDPFRVKAIDFGNILFIKGEKNLDKVELITQKFFDSINTSTRPQKLEDFANFMNISLDLVKTSDDAAIIMRSHFIKMNTLIYKNENGMMLCEDKNKDLLIEITHILLVSVALIDSMYNTIMRKNESSIFFQLYAVYDLTLGPIYNGALNIFQRGNINLKSYLAKLSHSYRESTIQCYKNISKKFCKYLNTVPRGDFPNLVIDNDLPRLFLMMKTYGYQY
jgi:hypothetical protein